MTTQELRALMALADVNLDDIAKFMSCSASMIGRAVKDPRKHPIKSQQIHLLLTDWVKPTGYSIIKSAA